MYRLAEKTIVEWSSSKNRKPLIVRGARQVGKSTLIRNTTKKIGLKLIEINLERHLELNDIFSTFNTSKIISEIEGILKTKIVNEESLLFLDEIQATPQALAALRYFYEDQPDLRVIAAGSLLEFTLSNHNFSMPVGRIEYLHLGPMQFEEFLLALKEDFLFEALKSVSFESEISDSVHNQLLQKQREFLATGGMPEAILAYVEEKDFNLVSKVQATIVETYKDDFAKYSNKSELNILRQVFNKAPQLIGQKTKYTNFSKEYQSREVRNAIELLAQARILIQVFHSSCSGLPLLAQENINIYKLFFLDVGLILHQTGLEWRDIKNLSNFELINQGELMEQFIAQHLLYNQATYKTPSLNYWLREGRVGNAEVDFVISNGKNIIPIEVKAGKSGTLKSLHQFIGQKKQKIAIRFDLNKTSVQSVEHKIQLEKKEVIVNYSLYSIPSYAVGELSRILEEAL